MRRRKERFRSRLQQPLLRRPEGGVAARSMRKAKFGENGELHEGTERKWCPQGKQFRGIRLAESKKEDRVLKGDISRGAKAKRKSS